MSRETISAARRRPTPSATSSATASSACGIVAASIAGAASDDDRDLALGRLRVALRNLGRCPPHDLLEALRELPADRHRARRMGLCKRGEAGGKPPGRLEGHDRMRPARQLLPQGAQCTLAAGQVADELVPLADEPARHERRLDRRGPGNTVTGTPASIAAAISRAPGSLTPGRPASLASAIRSPACSRGSTSAVRAASLCSW